MTDSSGWKLIKLRTSVPIRCRGRRRCSINLKLQSHSRFVTDRCRMMLTERNRKNYGFHVKPVRDFRKLRRQNIRVHFSPIRSTPGLCGFWKGYRLPPIKVNNNLTCLFEWLCHHFVFYKLLGLHFEGSLRPNHFYLRSYKRAFKLLTKQNLSYLSYNS